MRKHHENIDTIDYYAYLSPLRKWNATFKVIFAITILFLCISENNIAVSVFVILSMGFLSIAMGKVHLHDYISLMMIPITFIMLSGIAIAVELGWNDMGWYLTVTKETIVKSLHVSVKALGAISALYMLTLSTPVNEIILVLQKLRIPKIMIELMNMMYRYLFILMDIQIKIKVAAEARLGYCDFMTACHTFGKSLGSLFIMAMKKSGQYYDALEARCYDGELRFLEEEKPVHRKELLLASMVIVIMCALGFMP